ncbi:MAG: NAD(P)/FAD-dependent oxidoreductase [Planctomycetota bacterium]
MQHRVVILGGGFGGLYAARKLRRAPVRVTLVDRRNFHLFQPLLYQVATGGLSPANIAAPLRAVVRRQGNAQVLLAEARGFDVARRRVLLSDGEVEYDSLLVATGVENDYFGNESWRALAPGLKTVEDAAGIRGRILGAFEAAERDPAASEAQLTFVIVGGGPTGVELAGALGEISRYTLRRDFRRIDPSRARIVLVEGAERVLSSFPASLAAKAARALGRLGVEVRAGTRVAAIEEGAVRLEGGETLRARTVLWAAGVRASALGAALARETGARTDRMGRLHVLPDLTLPGRPEIFVLGDLAHCAGEDGKPLPGVAPVAMQQGRYASRLVAARLRGESLPPFRYTDMGTMATIGRAAAVADLRGLRFSGYPAWLIWLFVHLINLIQFESKMLVLFQWAWSYVTFGRTARLITGEGGPAGEGHMRATRP